MLNSIALYGTLTRDFEVRYTTGDKPIAIATSSVAVNDKMNKDKTHFFEIKAFGKTAENLGKYFKKGDPLLFRGELNQETWSKDGKNYSKVVVKLEEFEFTRGSKRENTEATSTVAHTTETDDDMLPF